jgi:beta-lactamase superfamily II metal-dependent hydrolase
MITSRRRFVEYSAMLSGGLLLPASVLAKPTPTDSRFTLWQLPLLETKSQGNSYVFRTRKGKVIVVDGGVPGEAGYLRGFLGVLGNHVDAWFLSHPHNDHVGALNEILKKPEGIVIETIYHSEISPSLYKDDRVVAELYNNLKTYRHPISARVQRDPMVELDDNLTGSPAAVVDVHPGLTGEIDGVNFKIIAAKNEEIKANQYNNSSVVVKVWDQARSVMFLGDAGDDEGEKILNGPFRHDLDCDFLQMAHHGQQGVSKKFYQSIKFKACLWPTPRWLWDNYTDQRKGFNTGPFKTVETREWMKELGIQKHFLAADGLQVIK